MQLTLCIENYKSIGKAQLELRPGLNILVGPNGSGKTCLMSSLKFIRDVFRSGAAQALARQGGSLRVYKHGASEMTFSIRGSYGSRTYRRKKIPCRFLWAMKLSQAGDEKIATIVDESFEIVGSYKGENVTLFSVNVARQN